MTHLKNYSLWINYEVSLADVTRYIKKIVCSITSILMKILAEVNHWPLVLTLSKAKLGW